MIHSEEPNEQIGVVSSLFHVTEASFSISLRPLLLEEIPGNARTGCLVTTGVNENSNISSDEIPVRDRIRMSWRLTCQRLSDSGKDKLLLDVKYLLSSRTDDSVEILEACKRLSAATSAIAGADEADWLFPPRSSLRKYAFLRRLAMPMYHVDDGATVAPVRMDVSLLNLLLDLPDLTDLVSQVLNQRLWEIKDALSTPKLTGWPGKRLRQLYKMLLAALERAGCSVQPDIDGTSTMDQVVSETRATTELEWSVCSIPPHISTTSSIDQVVRGTFAIPERIRKDPELRIVHDECARLLRELEERKKNTDAEICHYTLKGEIRLPYRIRNGTLLVTEQELLCEEFIRQKRIMKMVNARLARSFYPGVSRPKMHKASLSEEARSRLRLIFFDEKNGRLRKSIVNDVDKSSRHGYIGFSNSLCSDKRNDYRWQVPLLRHSKDQYVVARALVETLLSKSGLIHRQHEKLHDLGILIGGTEDQSIHHDIPRQTTSWLPQDPEMSEEATVLSDPVAGWEYDRAAYNEAMASSYAPCSVLIGMGGNGKINVGVQKNQIDRLGCPEGWCRIVDGNEQYRIVREGVHLVVLEANPGILFTGEFPHAGVRNFPEGSPEDKLMTDFFRRVLHITQTAEEEEEEGREHDGPKDVTMDIISLMCNFDNLDKICRFHCSTEPLIGPLRIPRNTVGFVECLPNPPTEGVVGRDPIKQPILFSASCPLCQKVLQSEEDEKLDGILSLHMHACENSRTTRSRRGAKNPID